MGEYTCGDCSHFRNADAGGHGECFRYPPTRQPERVGRSRIACGEFPMFAKQAFAEAFTAAFNEAAAKEAAAKTALMSGVAKRGGSRS